MTDLSERRRRKNLDVMISSTSKDLPNHRQQAMDAINRAGMGYLVMETLGARLGDAISESLDLVDLAEIYVGIIGKRYGYIPDDPRNPEHISVTEMEYNRAMSRGIPVLIFIMADDHPLGTVGDLDNVIEPSAEGKAKLKTFTDKLKTKHVVGFFNSPEVLRTLIVSALNQPDVIEKALAKAGEMDKPSPTDKPSIPAPPNLYSVPPYILTNTFIGRREELEQLDVWAKSEDSIMIVDAIGGMGKSALTWEWVNNHARKVMPNLAGIVWWSFYETGQTMNSFIRHALAYVTQQDPESQELKNLSYNERANRLLVELQRAPYLLVLDGFERALVAYHRWDAAQMRDDSVDDPNSSEKTASLNKEDRDLRDCTDPRDADVLLSLVAAKPSKLLISTRLMPSRLDDAGTPIKGVKLTQLRGLNPEDAYQLMQERGIKQADPNELDRFMKQFGYHSLLLKMLAGRIKNYRRAPGDFDRWHDDEGRDLRLVELDIKQKRTHILAYAFEGLDPLHQKLLGQIAAFSDAANYEAISIFNPYLPPAPEKVYPAYDSDLDYIKWDIENALTDEERQQFQKEFVEAEAKFAQQKLAYEAYLKAVATYPKSTEYRAGLATFDAALTELEERGLLQWDRAADSYDLHPVVRGYSFDRLEEAERKLAYERIQQYFESLPQENTETANDLLDLKNTITIYKALIGAGRKDDAFYFSQNFMNVLYNRFATYYAIVELFEPLFPDGWDNLPALTSSFDQSDLMAFMASVIDTLGDAEYALYLLEKAIEIDLREKADDYLATHLNDYGAILASGGELAASDRAYQLALEIGLAVDDLNGVWLARYNQCSTQLSRGNFEAADELLKTLSETVLDAYDISEDRWLLMQISYRVEKGISLGEDVSADLKELENLYQKDPDLGYGMASLYTNAAHVAFEKKDYTKATEYLQSAIQISRKTGAYADRARSVSLLAKIQAALGNQKQAEDLLAEIDDSAPLITRAEIYRLLGNSEKAKEYALRAYEAAWADGPPYIVWWDLKDSKALLDALGVPYPDLPPFDESKVVPLALEDELRAFIEELKLQQAEYKASPFNRSGAADYFGDISDDEYNFTNDDDDFDDEDLP